MQRFDCQGWGDACPNPVTARSAPPDPLREQRQAPNFRFQTEHGVLVACGYRVLHTRFRSTSHQKSLQAHAFTGRFARGIRFFCPPAGSAPAIPTYPLLIHVSRPGPNRCWFCTRSSLGIGCTRFISQRLTVSSILKQVRQGRSSQLGCLLYTLLSILIVVVNRCLWITRGSSLSSYLSTTCAIFLAWRSVNLWCTWKMNNFFHRRNKQSYPETINRLCTSSSPSRCPQAC